MTSIDQKLKESEEKFSKTVRSSPSLIVITRMDDGRIVDVNDAFTMILGYKREELIGHSTLELNLWVDPQERSEFLKRLKADNKVDPIDVKVYTKSGEILTTLFSGDIIVLNNEPHLITIASDISDRRKAEQELKESEEKYRSLFNNMTEGFAYHKVIVDKNNKPIDYKYIEVNPEFEKFTGLKADQMIGRKVTEILPGIENDPADWIGKFGKVGLTGIPLVVEDYSKSLDRWYNVSGYSPKKGYFAVTFTDITEQKKIEQRIKGSELKFRDLYEEAPTAYFSIGKDKSILRCNRAAEKLLGYTEDEFLKMNVFDLYANSEFGIERAKHVFTQFLEGETIEDVEIQMRNKNGNLVWISLYMKPILDQEGNIIESRSTILDITDRKKAEETLKESEEKFRSIFESIPDLFFLVSGDTTILDYKGNLEELYLPPEEFLGKKMTSLMPESVAVLSLNSITKTLETHEPHIIEYNLDMNGENRFYEARHLYFSEDRVLVFVRDITERKNTQEDLLISEKKFRESYDRANCYKDLFAHDINNILQVINSSAELIREELTYK